MGDGQWRLYDLAEDPGETRDVSADHPELFQDMLREYEAYAAEVGVYEMAAGESANAQVVRNSIKKFAANYWYLCVAVLVALALAVSIIVIIGRRLVARLIAG